MSDLAKQIAQKHGQSDLVEMLANGLTGSQLHTVLLAAIKERIKEQPLSELTKASKVTQACNLDGRLLHQVEGLAYQSAKDYKVVELAPLNPLGTTRQLSGLDQGNILSTIRAFEVASDPTVGLALHSAHLRKSQEQRKDDLRLCSSQRVVRFPEPTNPAYTSHFKLFSMVDSGRDRGSFAFELTALKSQLAVYLDLLAGLSQCGFSHKDIVVELSDTRVVKALCQSHGVDADKIKSLVRASDSDSAARLLAQYDSLWIKAPVNIEEELGQYNLPAHLLVQLQALQMQVMEPLSQIYKHVTFCFNLHRLTGLSYYQGPTLHLKLKDTLGHTFMVADGGFVDWTQRLLADKKERLLTSAIGTELLCRVFSLASDRATSTFNGFALDIEANQSALKTFKNRTSQIVGHPHVFSTRGLRAGETIAPNDVNLRYIPATEMTNDDFVGSIPLVVGRRITKAVEEGQQISIDDLEPMEDFVNRQLESIRLYKQTLPYEQIRLQKLLADSLWKTGKIEQSQQQQARQIYLEILPEAVLHYGENSPEVFDLYCDVSILYKREGNRQLHLEYCQKALSTCQSGNNNPERPLKWLCAEYEETSNHDQLLECANRLLDWAEGLTIKHHIKLTLALDLLASALESAGKSLEADRIKSRMIAVELKMYGATK